MRWPAVTIASLVAGWASAAGAVERFPPPDFTRHELPPTVVPLPEAPWLEYVWLALLVAGMITAALFALRWRRRWGLLLTAVAALVLFGFLRGGCVCSIGAIQNVSLAAAGTGYVVPWVVVAFFALPLLFALAFGRVFCAAVCPLGAVQEMAALKPLQVPRWIDDALGLLAHVYLGLAVLLAATGTAMVICRYDPFVGFFRLGATVNMLVFGGALLLIGVFVGRPYCRYLCPLGVLLRWTSLLSKWHVRIPAEECIHCRLCEEACPYGAIREPTVPQSNADRRRGRRRLLLLLLALPLLIAAGGWLGGWLTGPLSRMHPTVRLAEIVAEARATSVTADEASSADATRDLGDRASERPPQPDAAQGDAGQGDVGDDSPDQQRQSTAALKAFGNTGTPADTLFAAASAKVATMRLGAHLFGAWVGLVIGGKLIALNLRRRRRDWQPDRGACVSCGRCFKYCPTNQIETNPITIQTH